MTPAECQPGTIVMWGDYVGVVESTFDNGHSVHRARVANWERVVPLEAPDGMCVDDYPPGDTADCDKLQLAPRFLVGGEWRVEGSPWDCDGFIVHVPEFPDAPWGWCIRSVRGANHATTFAAARQAVEKAVRG